MHKFIGKILSAQQISPYVSAILNSSSTALPRLQCPALNVERYKSLQAKDSTYFFALNLRNCKDILPRLLGSIVEVTKYLGVNRCALSIVEGNSDDGTSDILSALDPYFKDLGLVYYYKNSEINPAKGERIKRLSQLRNLALEPLVKKKKDVLASDDTTVLFLNDVAACAEDILELALQRRQLHADMTCGMDWTYVGQDPTFYDIWIARTLKGDSFFEVGEDGNWNSAWNLFWNDPSTRESFEAKSPFQVFACWNGAAAISAAPLMHGLKFRHSLAGECYQGEPTLLCKDLWHRGFRKIAVVPSVNLEYSDEKAADIKKLKGPNCQANDAGTSSTDTPTTAAIASHRDAHVEWQEENRCKRECINITVQDDQKTFQRPILQTPQSLFHIHNILSQCMPMEVSRPPPGAFAPAGFGGGSYGSGRGGGRDGRSGGSPPRTCNYCGHTGHYQPACLRLARLRAAEARVEDLLRRFWRGCPCNYCGRNGHWQSSCPCLACLRAAEARVEDLLCRYNALAAATKRPTLALAPPAPPAPVVEPVPTELFVEVAAPSTEVEGSSR
ncbi:hypothetical protein FLONG3_7237 [Fusarium longipes]|uniref:CCHC-type domain-containing protein n=1 Tax=Fusarium longipes TaxID=694270 RepID=A0A395SG88_9HYPO|nr:hypothetical protein FLONG3_7237 [Fusarium longipes]